MCALKGFEGDLFRQDVQTYMSGENWSSASFDFNIGSSAILENLISV